MTRWLSITTVLLLVLVVAGCPYDAKAPIGNPDPDRLDKQLLGAWSGTDAVDGTTFELLVLPFNGAEYYVELREKEDKLSRFRAYLVDVGGHSILQINEIDPEGAVTESYTLARYGLGADGTMVLRFIGEQIVPKAVDPKTLAAFLVSHWEDPALDDPNTKLILRRAEPPTPHLH